VNAPVYREELRRHLQHRARPRETGSGRAGCYHARQHL